MMKMLLKAIRSFFHIFRSFLLYQQMVFRLIWRAGLSPDFASVMAIQGEIRRKEALCLYELAQEAPPQGVIVEIGSYKGLSTVALAKGSSRTSRIPVFAIDPHDYRAPTGANYAPQDNVAFFKNVLFSDMAGMVRPIQLLSWETVKGWNKPVSLLWIDGNHEYEAVKRDFAEWSIFVITGGYVAFHDSIDPGGGPCRVVDEALQEGSFKLVKRVEKVSVLYKCESSNVTRELREDMVETTRVGQVGDHPERT